MYKYSLTVQSPKSNGNFGRQYISTAGGLIAWSLNVVLTQKKKKGRI